MILWEAYTVQSKVQGATVMRNSHGHSKRWRTSHKMSLRMVHEPWEKGFVDYADATLPRYCRTTGKVLFSAQLFVMVLGASDYTFVYATQSQTQSDWCHAHVKAFEYFGGSLKILVPDNLKSGVTDSCRFEPTVNRTYADLAEHYGAAVILARPRTPQDKSKAENGVQVGQRWLVTRLDKNKYYKLECAEQCYPRFTGGTEQQAFSKTSRLKAQSISSQRKSRINPFAALTVRVRTVCVANCDT